MADRRQRPRAVEAYEHYYAVSCAFTKGGVLRMGLTEFHFSPRSVVAQALGWADADHSSANAAAHWLSVAVERAQHILVPEWTPTEHEGQLRLW